MLQLRAKILYNKKIKGNYFHLVILAPGIARVSYPGQFLNIKVNDGYEPLLRRPFSIYRKRGSNIEFLYEVVGEATRVLSGRVPEQHLSVIGPLGNGFKYPCLSLPLRQAGGRQELNATRHTPSILVAGGMGVAPLLFLADKLVESSPLVLIGAKNKEQLLCEKEFRDLGCTVKLATDDGSRGFKGYVAELLKRELHAKRCPLNAIYACGPKPMLKGIAAISKKYKIPAQLSLEEHMACGIGACLGCVVDTKEGFKRVCKEGPVFNGEEIIW